LPDKTGKSSRTTLEKNGKAALYIGFSCSYLLSFILPGSYCILRSWQWPR